MRLVLAVWLMLAAGPIQGLTQTAPLTQKEACKRFGDAVVQVDGGGQSLGTGFLVSEDGYVLTANHVIRSPIDEKYFSEVLVTLSDGRVLPADKISPISAETLGGDFALLKIKPGERPYSYLRLGSTQEVIVGGDATIIGYPFSAIFPQREQFTRQFCLSAQFAGVHQESVPVPANSTNRSNVQVDTVYFQGPSVKGISGSPIISRDDGRVVGIVSTRMTGLSDSLMELRKDTAHGSGVGIGGVGDIGLAFSRILDLLDRQLANGLGSAVGIDNPKEALNKAQRKKVK